MPRTGGETGGGPCTHMCVSTYRGYHFFDSQQNELNMTICIMAETRIGTRRVTPISNTIMAGGKGVGLADTISVYVCEDVSRTNSNAKCMTIPA